jgi:hypothetical protein
MIAQFAKSKENVQRSNGFANLLSSQRNDSQPRFNRHTHRQGYGVSNSIDFINHTPISNHRVTSDGGTFLMKEPTKQQRRLGTADSGHGRQYLVTEYNQKMKDPHFTKTFSNNLSEHPKAYSFQKTEINHLLNAQERSKFVMRPSNYTFRLMRENYL